MAESISIVLDQILSPSTVKYRRVDIYEADGVTLWKSAANFASGSVNVDAGRDDRRTASFTFWNEDDELDHSPDGLWYNKIIKPYYGIVTDTEIQTATHLFEVGDYVAWQVGEFMIDSIASQNFPRTVSVTCRDYAKRLMTAKFGLTTTYAKGRTPESLVRTIAQAAGVSGDRMNLVTTGVTTERAFTFEPDTTRMKAINDIAVAYGCEVFFDAFGILVMRPFRDPATSAAIFTFSTGEAGSIASIQKKSGDSRIYNHIVVTGGDANTLPIVAQAENNDVTSPTHIDPETGGIGRRTYRYNSSFITKQTQAQTVADKFLALHALEEYEIDIDALVIPTLEAAEVVDIIDPDPDPNQPTRFFLHDFTIPFGLGTMSLNGRRVQNVS